MIDSGEKQTDNSKIKEAMSFRDVPLFDILLLNPTGLSGVVAKMAMSYKKWLFGHKCGSLQAT